jgi:hypothetical protein
MRLFADEDFPLPAVLRLRELGHDVLTALEAGIANDEITDEEVLALASRLGRAVATHNRRHFRRLHFASPRHAGLILCTRDKKFVRLADRIHSQISSLESLDGQLISVVRPDRIE